MCSYFDFDTKQDPENENAVIFCRGGVDLALLLHHTSTKFSPLVVKQLLLHFDITPAKFNKAFRDYTKAA